MSRDGRWFVWTSTRNSSVHSVDLFVARLVEKGGIKKLLKGVANFFQG